MNICRVLGLFCCRYGSFLILYEALYRGLICQTIIGPFDIVLIFAHSRTHAVQRIMMSTLCHQGPILLTWINFDYSMDKQSHAQ